MRPSICPLVAATVLTGLLALAACSDGDGGDDDDGAGLGTTSSIAPPTAPEVPPASPQGTGVVVIGTRGTGSSFAVTGCALDADDPEASGSLVRITGEGTTGSGIPFQVEVVRSATTAAAETFTDLISYTDTARILQVQRFESAGEVSDLRDPDARGTLLRTRDGGLSAVGIAGPPGTDVEGPGLVGFALDVTC